VISKLFNWYISKLVSIKTLLKTKRRISFRGSFVQSKEKHLKQGDKFQILKMLLQSYLYSFDYLQKDLEKVFKQNSQKQNKWCKRGPKC
jgi:hypothetical protein